MNRFIMTMLVITLSVHPILGEQASVLTSPTPCHTQDCEAWNDAEVDLSDLEDDTLLLEALENHKPTCWQATEAGCLACWALCKIKAGELGDHLKEHQTAYSIVGSAACVAIIAYFFYKKLA